jgi:hypothetical protein
MSHGMGYVSQGIVKQENAQSVYVGLSVQTGTTIIENIVPGTSCTKVTMILSIGSIIFEAFVFCTYLFAPPTFGRIS